MDDEEARTKMGRGHGAEGPAALGSGWKALGVAAGVFLALDLAFLLPALDRHAHFPWEEWPGFYAVLAWCVTGLLVVAGRFVLGPLMSRREASDD